MVKIIPLILSGGSGTRLWPLSRRLMPKQFAINIDGQSLFAHALTLTSNKDIFQDPYIICNEDHRFLVAETALVANMKLASIILERQSNNTAAAILAACRIIANNTDSDCIILAIPSDHLIESTISFTNVIYKARALAVNNKLVTIGIKPTHPNTNYGYINIGNAGEVLGFTEKPDQECAQQYFDNGSYLWNSGILLFQASTMTSEAKCHAPDIYVATQKMCDTSEIDKDFIWLGGGQCQNISIDYAILEKSNKIANVVADFNWNDLGTWESLESSFPQQGTNHIVGDVLSHNDNDCLLYSDHGLLITNGLSNLIIYNSKDATLVIDKNKCDELGGIVNSLKKGNRDEVSTHLCVHRPWGSYEEIDSGVRFKVKRIKIKAGRKISLQIHNKRAEHWIVVIGSVKVKKDSNEFYLHADQSTYIPCGSVHRLENDSETDVEIIEVQTGDYLKEDDIIRLDDEYGRA